MTKLTVLVPIDFSEPGKQALRWAYDYAQLRPCELHLFHVIEEARYEAIHEEMRGIEAEAQRQLKEMAPDAAARDRIGKIVQHVGDGKPPQAIVALAEKLGAHLIVMGTHGRTGVRRAVLGSVAEHVVRHAPCTVVTVKPG